jgi:hypothetical protein
VVLGTCTLSIPPGKKISFVGQSQACGRVAQ